MPKISVVINTLNEELNIPFALQSVQKFADEIIVVDMKSDDNTQKIAKESFGAKVFEHVRTGYVEPARNFAIKKATGDWILILDADEIISDSLANKIKQIVSRPDADFYRLPRKNLIFGKWIRHSGWWPDYNIRFFKKNSVYWSEMIHSVPETYGKGLDLEPNEDNAIVHNNYQSIEDYISRMNGYTTVQAKEFFAEIQKKNKKFNWEDIIKRPTSEFVSRYFSQEGYKDGLHGLAICALQSFSELVVALKVWNHEEIQQKREPSVIDLIDSMKEAQSDMNYWQADTLLKEIGGLKHRLKRKFKLP